MMIVLQQKPNHYYRINEFGAIVPVYEIPKKSGQGKRKATLVDAKENGYLVSVTTVSNIIPKPSLENWKRVQGILAALTLPKVENEPLEKFAERVVEDAESVSDKAMEFGRIIHAQIEAELINPAMPCSEDIAPFMQGVRKWIREHVSRCISVEKVVGDVMLGFAGRLDLHCELNLPGFPEAVVDFKTTGLNGRPPTWYLDWLCQLAAYGHCVKGKTPHDAWPLLVSVAIDSKQPRPAMHNIWSDWETGWELFQHCLAIWQIVNNYRFTRP